MQTDQPFGWVLYDDACGFCREWIPFWGPTLRKIGLAIAPLQAPWVAERFLMSDLRKPAVAAGVIFLLKRHV